jgi:hypothetical protein
MGAMSTVESIDNSEKKNGYKNIGNQPGNGFFEDGNTSRYDGDRNEQVPVEKVLKCVLLFKQRLIFVHIRFLL